MYFNYHAKVKKLIRQGELKYYTIVDDFNGIKPALVLYFKNHTPIPIRQKRFEEYFQLLENENYLKNS